MKIKNYHVFSKDRDNTTGFMPKSDTLVLKNKRVIFPIGQGNKKNYPNNAIPQRFIYEDMELLFCANPPDINGQKIDIRKKLFIQEVEIIGVNKTYLDWHEKYLIDKTWWNVQRLQFMFGTHWIQSEFKFWITILISSSALFITGITCISTCNSSKKIDKVEDWKESTQKNIENMGKSIFSLSFSIDSLNNQSRDTSKKEK